MNILLTFTGMHDPYSKGLLGEEEQKGPILSLLGAKSFDYVFLFDTPNTEKNTVDTKNALNVLHPKIEVEIKQLLLEDPTNYVAILKGLRPLIRDICSAFKQADYYISVASGTPQMHACWILLAASGEIPAHILHIRPHRFINKNTPMVSEVDFSHPEMPIIRPNVSWIEIKEFPALDWDRVLTQIGIVGDHPLMQRVLKEGAILSSSNVPILISGETGTGKELIARFIHRLSDRATEPFVPINCGGIPNGLVESYLFGHKKGAFTGAIKDQAGRFDAANGGTLFLDELAELPVSTQIKLLRVVQDGIIEPVGSDKPHKVDARIICATNKDLKKAIRAGEFREDLYYRLNVGEIHLHPLRERRSDIPKIALHILDRINAGLKKQKAFSPSALTKLQNYAWPGNIRDLENVIERSVLLSRKDVLDGDDITITETIGKKELLPALPEPGQGFLLNGYIESIRRQLVSRALNMAKGNKSEAARLLGISPQAIHKYLQKNEDLSI
jgi:DNA-binding NtrC family response regulator